FTAVCSPTQSDKGYGTFTMTTDGRWTYTLDNANCNVQALNACDTLTDTFTVTTRSEDPRVGKKSSYRSKRADHNEENPNGSVKEAGSEECGTPVATGSLTDVDVGTPDNTFTAVCSPTESNGGYGTFTMTNDGKWTYALDNANCKVQALNACDTLTDTFTVTT